VAGGVGVGRVEWLQRFVMGSQVKMALPFGLATGRAQISLARAGGPHSSSYLSWKLEPKKNWGGDDCLSANSWPLLNTKEKRKFMAVSELKLFSFL
jgi:hypothetical protein